MVSSIKMRYNNPQKKKEGKKWQESSTGMISVTELGRKSGHTQLAKRGRAEAMPVIPGSLSMEYSGFCEPERLGGICRKRMGAGRTYIAVSAVGVIRESGKKFWKPWWMTQTLSG